jgi:hypothetical protein
LGEVIALRHTEARLKGDERILGDSDFVEKILQAGKERIEKYEHRSRGYDFDWLVRKVAEVLGMERFSAGEDTPRRSSREAC